MSARRENDLRWIRRAGVALAAVLAFGLALPAVLMWRATPEQSITLEQGAVRLPPEPRLQHDPVDDYRRYLERQRARLEDWRVTEDGRARIPPDVAIEIMAERGGWRTEENGQ